MLTRKQVKKIYDDWKDKSLNFDEMIKNYCVDVHNYVVFKCSIEFKRGRDYEEQGLLTLNEYFYVKYMLKNGFELYLGEVNGKHSDVSTDADDFTFYLGNEDEDFEYVENYIHTTGKASDIDFFSNFSDQDCTSSCPKDDYTHTHMYDADIDYSKLHDQ